VGQQALQRFTIWQQESAIGITAGMESGTSRRGIHEGHGIPGDDF